MSTTPPVHINHVPPEVLLHIFSLTIDPPIEQGVCLSLQPLLPLSLVCHSWRELAQYTLFKNVQKLESPKQLKSILLTLDKYLLPSVTIGVGSPMPRAFNIFGLEALCIPPETVRGRCLRREVLRRARGLKKLTLEYVRWSWAELLVQENLQGLEELRFSEVTFEDDVTQDPVTYLRHPSPSFHLKRFVFDCGTIPPSLLSFLQPAFTELTELVLWNFEIKNLPEFERFLASLARTGSLRKLEIGVNKLDPLFCIVKGYLPEFRSLEEIFIAADSDPFTNVQDPSFPFESTHFQLAISLPSSITHINLIDTCATTLWKGFQYILHIFEVTPYLLPNVCSIRVECNLADDCLADVCTTWLGEASKTLKRKGIVVVVYNTVVSDFLEEMAQKE